MINTVLSETIQLQKLNYNSSETNHFESQSGFESNGQALCRW